MIFAGTSGEILSLAEGETVNIATLKETIVESYCLDKDIADRLEFSYKTIAGNQGKEKVIP